MVSTFPGQRNRTYASRRRLSSLFTPRHRREDRLSV
jgi:hypothetical protein